MHDDAGLGRRDRGRNRRDRRVRRRDDQYVNAAGREVQIVATTQRLERRPARLGQGALDGGAGPSRPNHAEREVAHWLRIPAPEWVPFARRKRYQSRPNPRPSARRRLAEFWGLSRENPAKRSRCHTSAAALNTMTTMDEGEARVKARARDEAVARLAARNDNVVDRPALRALELTDQQIKTLVHRLRWQQLQHGVYLVGAAPPTWRQQVRAALLAAGRDAVVSHRTAAALWRLDGAVEGVIELTVPVGKGPTPRGVVVHRTTIPSATRTIDGLRTPSIERVLIDYAAKSGLQLVRTRVGERTRKGADLGEAPLDRDRALQSERAGPDASRPRYGGATGRQTG